MNCSKCGGETVPREGISKKNDKPWKGNKCLKCGNMDFIRMENLPTRFPENPVSNSDSSSDTKLELLKLAVQLASSHTNEQKDRAELTLTYFKNLKLIYSVPPPAKPKEEDFIETEDESIEL